jgi:hypothetical protein
MIEEMLQAGSITPTQYKMYLLFHCNELGRQFFMEQMESTFLDEPEVHDASGVAFALYDGRRAVWREIHRALTDVKKKMQKLEGK